MINLGFIVRKNKRRSDLGDRGEMEVSFVSGVKPRWEIYERGDCHYDRWAMHLVDRLERCGDRLVMQCVSLHYERGLLVVTLFT